VRLWVLRTVNIKITLIWNVMPCSLIRSYQRFGAICCLHIRGGMEELPWRLKFFRNNGNFLPGTPHHITDDIDSFYIIKISADYKQHFQLTIKIEVNTRSRGKCNTVKCFFVPLGQKRTICLISDFQLRRLSFVHTLLLQRPIKLCR
jgi:hypothetical protein